MSAAETASISACPACGSRMTGQTCAACALSDLLGSSPATLGAESMPGMTFGRYLLRQRIARGGMGVVYEAEDQQLKRTVALKMIRGSAFADEAELARFTIEAEAAAGLDHEHIVPVYEVGQVDGQPFFTMKLIRGSTLADLLREGPLPPRAAAEMLSRVARAVHHAHQRGVLHRDLKPGNILLDEQGKPWLTDFGLAKLSSAESGITLSSDHLGTPHYMSPEAAAGQVRNVSTASDVWALGVLLWEMVTGEQPFRGSNPMDVLRLISESEPSCQSQTRVNADLLTVARRCMEKQPARRPGSAEFVADELDRWLRGEPILARRVSSGERMLKWARRKPAYVALAALFVFSLFTGLTLWRRAEKAVVDLSSTNSMLAHSLRISSATRLAGDSRQMVEENPARALLLAAEASEVTDERGEVLPGAFSALCDVLQRVGGVNVTPGRQLAHYREGWLSPDPQAHRIACVSPASRWLVTMNHIANIDGTSDDAAIAALYDLNETIHGEPLRRWRIDRTRGNPLRASVPAGCWLDERHFAILEPEGRVAVLDLVTPDLQPGRTETAPPASLWSRQIAPARAGAGIYDCWMRRLPSGEFQMFSEWADELNLEMIWMPVSLQRPGEIRKMKVPREEGSMSGIVSPDGRWWLAGRGGDSKDFPLYDLHQPDVPPKMLKILKAHCLLRCFTPDSSTVAICGHSDEITFFSTATGAVQRRVSLPGGATQAIALSPDQSLLALAGNSGEVTVVDLKDPTGNTRHYLRMPGGDAWSAAFSADGEHLAVGTDRRQVTTWKMSGRRDGMEGRTYQGSPTAVSHVQFSPDGRHLICAGLRGTVRRWVFDGGASGANPRMILTKNANPVGKTSRVTVSADGQWLASASAALPESANAHGNVMLARLDGKAAAVLCTHDGRAQSVAFSPDGRWLASTGADQNVNVWDLPVLTQALCAGQPPPAPRFVFPIRNVRTIADWSLAFHPKGVLYMADCDGYVTMWDLNLPQPDADRQEERVHEIGYLLPDITVSPDGRILAVARHGWDSHQTTQKQRGNLVLLFDVTVPRALKPLAMLPAMFTDRTQLSISADNRWLAAGAAGAEPTVWDLHAGDIPASRKSAPVITTYALAVAFSPDSSRLAIGTSDHMIHLWDWRTPGIALRSCRTELPVHALAWTPDNHLITGSTMPGVAVWDMEISRLRHLARLTAGRNLEPGERQQFVNGR